MFSFLRGIQGSLHFCTTTSQSASVLLNRKLLTATIFGEPAAVRNKATFRMSSFLLALPAYKHRENCLPNFLLVPSTFLESSGSERDPEDLHSTSAIFVLGTTWCSATTWRQGVSHTSVPLSVCVPAAHGL